MIKRIGLGLLLLTTVLTNSLNAQNKKAAVKPTTTATEKKPLKPSKQETMDWIAGKMKDNLGLGRAFVSYSDGKFVYKKEWKAFVFCETTIDLNKVTGISSEFSKDFFVSGKGLTFAHCDNDKPGMGSPGDYCSISGPNFNEYSAPFNFSTDDALVQRLRKAFATLIEYNATQKGEGESF